MRITLTKLKAMLLYFANHTDTKYLGKVKLMKLFYFADFMHVKRYGAPITYDRYVNLEHGPIPSTIKNLVDTASEDIDHSILADIITFENPPNTNMSRIRPLKKFTKKEEVLFSKNELETLKRVCQRFGNKNTADIEQASHKEAPWRLTNSLDEISYTLAVEDPDCEVEKSEVELLLNL